MPSESGEYHFHFSPAQMQAGLASLRAYRRALRRGGLDVPDYGSFRVGSRTYDILEYTRQGEAILHCQGDDTVTHTGIARMLVSP